MIKLICFINLFILFECVKVLFIVTPFTMFFVHAYYLLLFHLWRVRGQPFVMIGVGDLTCPTMYCKSFYRQK